MSNSKIRPPGGFKKTSVPQMEHRGHEKENVIESKKIAQIKKEILQSDPVALVQKVRTENMKLEEVVDILIENALAVHSEKISEENRTEFRKIMMNLITEDPLLSRLMSALKR